MNRHYYISDNLNDLETVEYELEASGINSEQIHVLSEKVADVVEHHLHEVNSLMKQDAVHSGEIGAVVGAPLAALVLGGAYWMGWTESACRLGAFYLPGHCCIWLLHLGRRIVWYPGAKRSLPQL